MESFLDQYVQTYLGDLLKSHGFQEVKYRGSRWVRMIDRSVFMSIQFVPYYSSFEVYYSFQPLFYPLTLPRSRIAYHDRFWTYFDPEADYYAITHSAPGIIIGDPFASHENMEHTAVYWKKILETAVFPLLDSICDVPSCCEAHRLQYSRAGVFDFLRLGFNGRYLLECAYLKNCDECERISNRFFVPLMQAHGAEYRIYVDYQGAEKINKAEKTLPVGLLISDIQGTMQVLQERMAENYHNSLKMVDAISRRLCDQTNY